MDKSLLRDFYLNNGYYDVQILTSDIEIINNSVNLIYSINAGEKYSFSKFEINDPFNILNSINIDEIKEIIKKDYDGVYSKSKINKIENAINNYLNLKKIQFFRLNILTNIIEDKKVLTKFDITKTDRKFVNLINISGNQITEEKFIRGLLPISEGDSLPQYKVNESKRNLINSGIFKKVLFNTEFVENELFDVDIKVEEQPTGSISAGLGIGSVESTIGGQLDERNLFGKGISASGNLTFGTQRVTGTLNADIPDFLNSNNTVGFGVIATTTEYDNAGYESSKYGVSSSIKYDLYEDVSIRPGFGLDLESVSALSNASDLTKKQAGDYFTMKGFYTIANDKRNRSFFTTDGHRIAFSQTLGLPGSEIPYINNELSASFYETLLPGYTISLKGQLEGINSLNNKDIKLSDRKYLSNRQLRGFENFATGPKDGSRYIGGNYSANGSISSTFPNPIPEKYNLSTLTFLDIGNIWGVDYDSSLDNNKIRSSIGVGVDWMSPIGPLSLTFSEVLSKTSSDLEESFSFQIGSSF